MITQTFSYFSLKMVLPTISALILVSCSMKDNRQDSWDMENMRGFEVDDPRILRARRATQDSMSYYVDYFRRFYGQVNYKFFVKSAIRDNEDVEYMWLKPFALDEDAFSCILDNEPSTIKGYRLGDTIRIRLIDIDDCIIITADTTIIGDYLKKELEN